MGQKVILVGRNYIIEPLGILYLAGLARQIGWDVHVELVTDADFYPLFKKIEEWKPDIVGFSIWTGYHLKAFRACDKVRQMGSKVIIGGPHATYFTDECSKHADWVVRGEGFRNFRRILQGEIPPGIHFDEERMAEGFPVPNRELVYEKYLVLRDSEIKSIFCSIGCPFACSYCYAPKYNEMYGGFRLNLRSVEEIVREGQEIRDHWPAKMIYFQDDIFGYDRKWLEEFVVRWKKEVGTPWHCQIRLELTRHEAGKRRLELFQEGGCTGITLAIESGDPFIREHVLHRPMPEDLILEGCEMIRSRGMTLRTEQILAVPFSNLKTDLLTLRLNCQINPEMAWTSILAPYGGTEMGEIAKNFGFYEGTNDDLQESFFDRSVLRHSEMARDVVAPVVDSIKARRMDSPLRRMIAKKKGPLLSEVCMRDERDAFSKQHLPGPKALCEIEFMDDDANARYAEQTIINQRLFNWLSKVPKGNVLAEKFVTLSKEQWTWHVLGEVTKRHLESVGKGEKAREWVQDLVHAMGCSSYDELPEAVKQNPYYFVFFPGSALFARHVVNTGALNTNAPVGLKFDALWATARHWLFKYALYRLDPISKAIAEE